jgi:uncharacterized protein (UPF0297 family)
MGGNLGETKQFSIRPEPKASAEDILMTVFQALKTKGYDPITQIVGYMLSGDPTYITSYNQARSLIRRLERDEILEELVRSYVLSRDNDL